MAASSAQATRASQLQAMSGGPGDNRTGLPDQLKSGIESLSGISLDNVKVHYNSGQPAQLNALAYAQGNDIHVAPGQEQHLPHEAWHIVQQAQGRVQPTRQLKAGVPVNDDAALEREADVMGAKALEPAAQLAGKWTPAAAGMPTAAGDEAGPVQRKWHNGNLPADAEPIALNKARREKYEELLGEAVPPAVYWNDASKSLFAYFSPEADLPASGAEYTSNDGYRDDHDADDDRVADIHEEATGLLTSNPLATRLGTALAQIIAPNHVVALLARENEDDLRWLAELNNNNAITILVDYILGKAGRNLASTREVLEFNGGNQNYAADVVARWIVSNGDALTLLALRATVAEPRASWVNSFFQCEGSVGSAAHRQLIRVRAYLQDGANTMAVYQRDTRFPASDPASLSRTGFLRFHFVGGGFAEIHTHWHQGDHRLVSMHVQSGDNGLEINKWLMFFDTVATAVRDAHNIAPGNLAPTGGLLSL